MEALRAYLKTMSPADQADYALRAGTTIGYLRKALSAGQTIGPLIAVGLDRESGGALAIRYGLHPAIFGPAPVCAQEGANET